MIGIGWRGQIFFCDFWIFGVFLVYFWCIFGIFEYATKIDLYLETGVPKKKMILMLGAGWWVPKNRKIKKSLGTRLDQHKRS